MRNGYINNFAAGIAMACTLMYIRVLFEAFVINQKLALVLLLPYAAASVSGLVFVYILYKYSKTATFNLEDTDIAKNPLQLSAALKFGLLFGIIYGVVSVVQAVMEILVSISFPHFQVLQMLMQLPFHFHS